MNSPPAKKLKVDGNKTTKVSLDVSDEFKSFISEIQKGRQKIGESIIDFKFNKKRCRMLSKESDVVEKARGILYWMSRDQRVQDNWALLFAQRLALKQKLPLHVCFCLVPTFMGATIRHYMFMIKGLREVEQECKDLDIQFHLLIGQAKDRVPEFVEKHNIGGVVTDFCPLRIPLEWVENVKKALPKNVPFCQVDAHNVVPCWHASDKQEYGARTIRKKIHDKLDEFLTEYPQVIKHPHRAEESFKSTDWEAAISSLEVDQTVPEVTWTNPGTTSGLKTMYEFCEKRLRLFADKRNDPNVNALSGMSPFFHYGQVSVQRAILVAKKYKAKHQKAYESFLEEAIIRRELADNFCYYQKNYDNIDGAFDWAKKTLNDHKKDKREFLYSKRQLEEGKTYDELWNASQLQLIKEGKMHGFMRMYWAKKVLEWTKSPEDGLAIAIYLNDRYSLDGRDPNGYVGCMWSICGIHDQGWAERPVFGKIRYMNYAGCKRKFDINSYIARYGGKAIKYTGFQE